MVWYRGVAWAHSHISPALYCKKIKHSNCISTGNTDLCCKSPKSLLETRWLDSRRITSVTHWWEENQDSWHKGWRSCETRSSRWSDSASTVPGWRIGQWLMHGITSEHQEPVLPEPETELIFRSRLFLKDKAMGSWSTCSEVPEFRPAMGTHFCKQALFSLHRLLWETTGIIFVYNKEPS